jgi:hypothetical protein
VSRPPLGLVSLLRLRDAAGWAMIIVESRWLSAPAPVRAVLRRVARVGPLRRLMGLD